MPESRSPKFPADQGRSRKVIDTLATRARRLLGFGPLEPISAIECMHRLRGYKIRAEGKDLPVVYGVKTLEPGVKGETLYSAQYSRFEIILSEETYSLLEESGGEDPHARFSFFHELGHASLHGVELMRLSRIPKSQADAFMRARYTNIPAYRDVEWQANTFSAGMMMPFPALAALQRQDNLNVANLCRLFSVSRIAAEIRLRVYMEEC